MMMKMISMMKKKMMVKMKMIIGRIISKVGIVCQIEEDEEED